MRKFGYDQNMTFPFRNVSKVIWVSFNTKVSLEKLQKFALTSFDLPCEKLLRNQPKVGNFPHYES